MKEPTWIYTWTNDASVLVDPAQLLNSLNATQAAQDNRALLCSSYLAYLHANSSKEKAAAKEALSDALASPNNAGIGLYFAYNPLASTHYGRYLLAAQVPPGRVVAYGKGDAVLLAEAILSHQEAVAYQSASFRLPHSLPHSVSAGSRRPTLPSSYATLPFSETSWGVSASTPSTARSFSHSRSLPPPPASTPGLNLSPPSLSPPLPPPSSAPSPPLWALSMGCDSIFLAGSPPAK